MSDIKDFKIKDGVLTRYMGSDAEVVIPDSVRSIGGYVFCDCKSLTSVIIPNSVKSISSGAFLGCSNLTSITVDENNKYYSSKDGVLFNKNKIELIKYPIGNKRISYNIPDSVTSIGDSAFDDCVNLTNVTIPNSVESIGDAAFKYCSNLKSVTIPNCVINIGDEAFCCCSNLKSVTIPNNVINIGDCAFAACSSLTSITVDENNKYYSSKDGVLFNKNKIELIKYPIGNKRISYNIPDSVTSIGDSAFDDCVNLINVTIPNSVESIGDYAFRYCENLRSVTIPNSVERIGRSIFFCCENLRSVTILDSVKEIGNNAFCYHTLSGYKNFTSIYLKNRKISDVSDVGKFDKMNVLRGYLENEAYLVETKEVNDSYVKYVKGQRKRLYKFAAEYKNLLRFMIDNEIIPVEDCDVVLDVVKDNAELTAMLLDYKNSKFTFDDEIKAMNKTLNVNPLSVSEMRKIWSFKKMDDGTLMITNYKGSDLDVVIPETIGKRKVAAIGEKAFDPYGNRVINQDIRQNIKSIVIPNGVISIEEWAFKNCSSLQSITIPNSVKSIGGGVFHDCKSLTSVTIPNSVTSIGGSVFHDCKSLTSVIIPNSVKSISSGAFFGCSNLTNITIPNSVKSIRSDAFFGCSNLTNITIPNSVTSIGSRVFRDCKSLTSVTISNSVKSIGGYVFCDCKSLTSVIIPNSVKSISSGAFWGCSNLTSITIPDSITSIANFAFYGCSSLTIHAKTGSYAEQFAKRNQIPFEAE